MRDYYDDFEPLDRLRLDVERDPGLGEYLNHITNPSGALGGVGWYTPTPGSTIGGTVLGGTQCLVYTTGAYADNQFETELQPIRPGWWARAQAVALLTPGGRLSIGVRWYDSSKALISQSMANTNATSGSAQATIPAQAPAGTAYVSYSIRVLTNTDAPWTTAGTAYVFKDARLVTAPTSAALPANLAVAQTAFWTNVLGPTHYIAIKRSELNVGTLSATVLDATLDPSQASLLRPGRRVRVTALDAGGTTEPLFTGKLTRAEITYDLHNRKAADPDHARISLTATDATQTLAGVSRALGVATVDELPEVLEDAGVPWMCNGNSGHLATTPPGNSWNENATALDQVALTRDSTGALAWVDRYGVLQVWDSTALPQRNLVTNPSAETNLTGWAAVSGCNLARAEFVVGIIGLAVVQATSTGAAPMVVNTTPTGTSAAPVTPGLVYAAAVDYIRQPSTQASPPTLTRVLQIVWYDAAGAPIKTDASPEAPMPSGAGGSVSVLAAAPAGAAYAAVRATVNGSTAAGEIVLMRGRRFSQTAGARFDEDSYSDITIGFDTDRCVNSVGIKYLAFDGATTTTEVAYGPYTRPASISVWGRHHMEYTVHGSTALPAQRAAQILRDNAAPTVVPERVRVPIRARADLTTTKALLDVCGLVQVINTDKALSSLARINTISHSITPEGWLMDLELVANSSTGASLAQPPLPKKA